MSPWVTASSILQNKLVHALKHDWKCHHLIAVKKNCIHDEITKLSDRNKHPWNIGFSLVETSCIFAWFKVIYHKMLILISCFAFIVYGVYRLIFNSNILEFHIVISLIFTDYMTVKWNDYYWWTSLCIVHLVLQFT